MAFLSRWQDSLDKWGLRWGVAHSSCPTDIQLACVQDRTSSSCISQDHKQCRPRFSRQSTYNNHSATHSCAKLQSQMVSFHLWAWQFLPAIQLFTSSPGLFLEHNCIRWASLLKKGHLKGIEGKKVKGKPVAVLTTLLEERVLNFSSPLVSSIMKFSRSPCTLPRST